MQRFQKIIFALTATLSLGFTGCQTVKKPAQTSPTLGNAELNSSVNQFYLTGKIGIKTPQQSGSAFYTWEQNQDTFNIQLNGVLGIGKTIIEGRNGSVQLNSSKTGLITATTPEELLERATGWVAPITHIVDWVQAHPATQQAQVKKDASQRIVEIDEDHWNVVLSYDDQAQLPNKLFLKQQLTDGQENRITMLIQNR